MLQKEAHQYRRQVNKLQKEACKHNKVLPRYETPDHLV